VESVELAGAPAALAKRLRTLREQANLTQAQLGHVLGLSDATISSWEGTDQRRMPQPDHLRTYAHFFATRRSWDGGRPRLLADADLGDGERDQRVTLERELLALREVAVEAVGSATRSGGVSVATGPQEAGLGEVWRFSDGANITIVCSGIPESLRKRTPLAEPSDPNYVDFYNNADLDALVELYGHIRAVNPASQVSIQRAGKLDGPLDSAALKAHLILLGGVDWNAETLAVLGRLQLPIQQVSSVDQWGAYFEVSESGEPTRFRPKALEDTELLEEDVGHFYRGRNPYNIKRTVTICNGIFARGTYGVVRALTDADFRDRNEAYLRRRFPGAQEFSILMRVPVAGGLTMTPQWDLPDALLHEWPRPPT